jgi:hypothetical protein
MLTGFTLGTWYAHALQQVLQYSFTVISNNNAAYNEGKALGRYKHTDFMILFYQKSVFSLLK